ncbi:hypothetical protein [Actinocrispum sp. NPDC049592]|uniref:hypothetical protein n=1 Tax=Actinocrispum sp. NPDC049592 TaxID=3154835 RepID=UPI00341E1A0D
MADYVHIGLSAVFFLSLAVFCFRFTLKEQDPLPDPQRKQLRNRIYITCGVVILVCLALIALFGWVLENWAEPAHPVLWLEALATVAFGWSWFIKGKTLWKDNPPRIPALTPPADDAQPPATTEAAPV